MRVEGALLNGSWGVVAPSKVRSIMSPGHNCPPPDTAKPSVYWTHEQRSTSGCTKQLSPLLPAFSGCVI